MQYLYTKEYYSAFKKKATLSSVTWVNLEDFMQSDKYCMISLLESKKKGLTHRSREYTGGFQCVGVAMGRCQSRDTKFQSCRMNKFWRANV